MQIVKIPAAPVRPAPPPKRFNRNNWKFIEKISRISILSGVPTTLRRSSASSRPARPGPELARPYAGDRNRPRFPPPRIGSPPARKMWPGVAPMNGRAMAHRLHPECPRSRRRDWRPSPNGSAPGLPPCPTTQIKIRPTSTTPAPPIRREHCPFRPDRPRVVKGARA